ncbi:hypothetical protein A7P95_07810 [Eikenella longinqua]|uniref:Uncharacterized protein n=1 Tax=Eikenella longinqua TaxID=1795827 RepID=A0A1A9RVA1_9NEIS|nr:hypothetical protein A7P95_07810 [Eikenella longinqua]
MALDGFGAALVTDGQLCERLLAVDVLLQQLAGRREFGDGQVLLAGGTFISLPAVFTAVLNEGTFMAKRAFLTNIGKKSLKAMYGKASSDFYHPICPLVRKMVPCWV